MSNVLEVILNLVDNLSSDIESAVSSITGLETAATTADQSLQNIDTASIDNLATAAESAGLSVEQIEEAASMAGAGLGSIDDSNLDETAGSAENAAGGMEEAAGAAGLLEAALGAVVATGIVEYLDGAANAAGARADDWSTFAINMTGSADSMEAVKEQYSGVISEIQSVTGRGFGETLTLLDSLSIAGITNVGTQKSLAEAVSGTAWRLQSQGATIGSVTNATKRMIITDKLSNRQLVQLGLSLQDFADYLGMTKEEAAAYFETLDDDGQAALISQVMLTEGAAAGNEDYKESWEHLNDALGRAFDAISRIAGEMLLPILTPAIEGVTWLLGLFGDALEAVPSSLEPVFGAIMLVVGALVSIWGGLTSVSGVLSAAGLSFAGLGVGGSAAGVMLEGFLTILGPVGWAIAAIIAIIAAGIYIWQNWSNEIIALKDALISGDWASAAELIGNCFTYIKDGVWNALNGVWTYLVEFFTSLPGRIGAAASTLVGLGNQVIHWLVEGLTSLSGYLAEVINSMLVEEATAAATSGGQTAGEAGGKSLIDGLKEWIITNGPTIMDSITTTFWTLLPLILQLLWQILTIITATLLSGALNAGRNFVYGIILWIQQLPGRVWAYLMQVVGRVLAFASQAGSNARAAGQRIYNGIRTAVANAPGMVYNELLRIVGKITSIGGAAYDAAYRLGESVYNGIKSALGIGSPGYMFYMMEGELKRITDLMGDKQTAFRSGSYNLGDSIITGFNGAHNSTGGGVVNNNTGLTINVDLTGTPIGNSDRAIADFITKDLAKDTKFLSKLGQGMGRVVNQKRRATGA